MPDFDLKFKTVRSPKLDQDIIVFNGTYDPLEDKDLFPCIEIEVLYSAEQKDIDVAHIEVDRIIRELCETIYHEKTHQRQYRNRKFARPKQFKSQCSDRTVAQEQEYLGSPDEVEAYAAEIAVDLYLTGQYNLEEDIQHNSTYRDYVETFGPHHPVVENLFEHSVKYFNKLKEQDHVLC